MKVPNYKIFKFFSYEIINYFVKIVNKNCCNKYTISLFELDFNFAHIYLKAILF
jgi:hypothetical protein